MLTVHRIDAGFHVSCVGTPFAPDVSILSKVDQIWNAAVKEQPGLFDGGILRVEAVNEKEAVCSKIPYRFFFAQLTDPALKEVMRLESIGVSGVLTHGEYVFYGRRASGMTEYPGMFELVPSGSLPCDNETAVTIVDFRAQLLNELEEEVGISRAQVKLLVPVLLVKDEHHLVYDVVCRLELNEMGLSQVLDAFQPGEYSELYADLLTSLTKKAREQPEQWVPTSLAAMSNL